MALKIRLQRGGKSHAPRYRLVVAEGSSPRDGKFVEILGNYNPQARKNERELDLKMDRIDYWINVGAKPSDTVRTMINRARREGLAESADQDSGKPEGSEEKQPEVKDSTDEETAPEAASVAVEIEGSSSAGGGENAAGEAGDSQEEPETRT